MATYRPRVSLCTDPRPAAVRGSQLGLACENSAKDEDLAILTDSLSSMNLLKNTQEERFSTLAVSSRGATASDTCGQPDEQAGCSWRHNEIRQGQRP